MADHLKKLSPEDFSGSAVLEAEKPLIQEAVPTSNRPKSKKQKDELVATALKLQGITDPDEPQASEVLPANLPEGFVEVQPQNRTDVPVNLPAGFVEVEPEDTRSVATKIGQRFLGTDVDDPLDLTRLGTTIGGAVIGANIGLRVPTVPGPAGLLINPGTGALLGSATGAFLGAVAPEATIEAAEFFGLVPEGTRDKIGASPTEVQTMAEGEILLDLATGGGIVIVRVGGKFISGVFTGARKLEALKTAGKAQQMGIDLMPIQVGNRTLPRQFVVVFARFPFIGSSIRKTGVKAQEAFKRFAGSIPGRFGSMRTFSEVSETIFTDAKVLLEKITGQLGKEYDAIYKSADELGVQYVPSEVVKKGKAILRILGKETPKRAGEQKTTGEVIANLRGFIEQSILTLETRGGGGKIINTGILDEAGKPIFKTTPTTPAQTIKQTLRQMDGIITEIDEQIVKLEPGTAKFVMEQFNQLRQAALGDVFVHGVGSDAQKIGKAIRELDKEFSFVMAEMFESATAKMFTSVQRRGLRGLARDETTRIPVDALGRIVVKLDSPQAMRDLAKIVTPKTYKEIAAHVVDDAINDAIRVTDEGFTQFSPERLAKRLGLDNVNGSRFKAVSEMLERSNSPMKMKDFQDMIEVAEALRGFDIPNVSSFIARRASIAGLKGALGGIIPGLTLAGGVAAGGKIGGLVSAFTGFMMFVGGGKLISAIISNPNNLKTFRAAMRSEASAAIKRKGFIQAIRAGLVSMKNLGQITGEELKRWMEFYDMVFDEHAKESRLVDDVELDIRTSVKGQQFGEGASDEGLDIGNTLEGVR